MNYSFIISLIAWKEAMYYKEYFGMKYTSTIFKYYVPIWNIDKIFPQEIKQSTRPSEYGCLERPLASQFLTAKYKNTLNTWQELLKFVQIFIRPAPQAFGVMGFSFLSCLSNFLKYILPAHIYNSHNGNGLPTMFTF